MSGRARFDRSRLPSVDEYLEHRVGGRYSKGRERRGACPIADHSSPDPFSINSSSGVWQCFSCGRGGDLVSLHQERYGLSFLDAVEDLGALVQAPGYREHPAVRGPAVVAPIAPPAVRQQDPGLVRKRETATTVWRGSQGLAGTLAARYLTRRGCMLPPVDGDLRFRPGLSMFGFDGPVMVGSITNVQTGELQGAHLTWLDPDGAARRERRYLGPKASGVIRLWPDESVTTGLAIAEGIETALALAHAFTPVWACMDAGNLASFPVLGGIESLTIAADNDESGAGQRAALECAERWLDAGREVRILMSDVAGRDLLDEVAA